MSVPCDPAEKMKDLVRQRGAICGKSILLYIRIQNTSWGTQELYIGIKLVNAFLQKVLAYVIRMAWLFVCGVFLVLLGFLFCCCLFLQIVYYFLSLAWVFIRQLKFCWNPYITYPIYLVLGCIGYVQASKQDKKFMACAPDYSYAALCECLRRVFIYRQPTPLATVLYNRKEGRQVGQVAKQLVATLEANDPILGFQATSERLFVLTTKTLFLIKVNSGN